MLKKALVTMLVLHLTTQDLWALATPSDLVENPTLLEMELRDREAVLQEGQAVQRLRVKLAQSIGAPIGHSGFDLGDPVHCPRRFHERKSKAYFSYRACLDRIL